MNKKHVTSLELSKQLHEAGIKAESEFKWCVWDREDEFYEGEEDRLFTETEWEEYATDYVPPKSTFYPAYLTSELMEMLPRTITKNDKKWIMSISKDIYLNDKFLWRVQYRHGTSHISSGAYEDITNSVSHMLVYLKQEGLV